MQEYKQRWGRATTMWIGVGLAYGVVLIIAAFVVPIFTGSWGFSTTNADTLVAQHGLYAALVVAVPLILAVGIAFALLESYKRGARALAWSLWGVLALGNLAALFTIGVFVLPITIAMFLACRLYVAPDAARAGADA